jgi:hypothetical protein
MSRSFLSAWWKNILRSRAAAAQVPARPRPALESLEERVVMNGSLVAAYNFDAGGGSTLVDVSGNGNNGAITNAQWTKEGKFGGALVFNGQANSLVSVANAPSLDGSSGLTLEAWVDPYSLTNAAGGASAVLAKEQLGPTRSVGYGLDAASGSNRPPAGTVLVGGVSQAAPGGAALPLDQWDFLATTYDGTTLKTYVNGALVASREVSGGIQAGGGPLTIGGDAFSQMFTGKIDNVRIYNYALTAAQLNADMNTPVVPQTTKPTTTPLGAFARLAAPWGSDQVHCTAVDPAGQNVFFAMNSGAVWRLNEPTGTWACWHTPGLVTSLALAGPGELAVGDGVGVGTAAIYHIDEGTGKVTKAAVPPDAPTDWQVLGLPSGAVLAFDSFHGNVFRSTDGGLTYQEIASPGSEAVIATFVAANGAAYMGGEGVYPLNRAAPVVSHDGGLTWQSSGVDVSDSHGNLYGLGQANNGDILVGKMSLTGAPVLRISSKGRVTASAVGLPPYTAALSFATPGNNEVLTVCVRKGYVQPFISYDDGHTWQKVPGLPSINNLGVVGQDYHAGYAVSANWVYYYDTNGLYRAVR